MEQGTAENFWPHSPALVYVESDGGTRHQVDADRWDPTHLSARERVICLALLRHATARLAEGAPGE